ncbi:Serine/threonine-protein kinase Nek1 [Zea mays]|uniref:Serine/threonine-protein kinase Nek1 n=1 Tax=Zea mays TaxID=4577 RepID=A0A1D6MW39_MAIZE|nr:Serine/threonine-protein kinase Nek1 [Zea mays]
MDQYEVLEQIGKGAFGSALLMQLIATVRNPFIVEYKDSWVEKGCYVCIVIGYCEGGDMAEVIKRANGNHFSEEKLCKWLVQLLMALDYLHANHILHRDVKCSNIFIARDQSIRLGDFGLAKILTSDDLASSVVGTPSYMCPELLADIPYGTKSDIWSLGCCIYEMTALRPAFKAFDMQALISKITKSIVSPLPTRYSGSFRGLIKSMLRKSPEHRPSAAELLKHVHLQPYVLQVQLKSSPSRNMSPIYQALTDKVKKMTFPSDITDSARRVARRNSLGNERTVTFCKPSPERNSISSTRSIKEYTTTQSVKELSVDSSQIDDEVTSKAIRTKTTGILRTPKSTPAKTLTTRNRLDPPKTSYSRTNHSELTSRTPLNKSAVTARRASLPLPTYRAPNSRAASVLDQLDSPDVSVNAPRIDRIAEFPLASSEDPLAPMKKNLSSAPGHDGSCSTPPFINRSITKDKYTVQVLHRGDGDNASDSSGRNATAASSGGSNDSRQQRFDTSSYQQRAEALEGLLEFSAQLLQQERYEELGILLKPFGPEKASPRETAIWLTKSFKETAS